MSTQTPTTVTLQPAAGRIAVLAGDTVLGTIKDGGHIVRNAERLISGAGIVRTTGYDSANGLLVAQAVLLG